MARRRMIKPEFWRKQKMSTISRDARLLFIGLWNIADDKGRLELNDKIAKAEIFPYDEDVTLAIVHEWLMEIASLRCIVFYHVDGIQYAWIPKFLKHQTINRPTVSSLPAYDDSVSIHELLNEDSVNTVSQKPELSSKGTHGIISEESVSTHSQVKLNQDKLSQVKGDDSIDSNFVKKRQRIIDIVEGFMPNQMVANAYRQIDDMINQTDIDTIVGFAVAMQGINEPVPNPLGYLRKCITNQKKQTNPVKPTINKYNMKPLKMDDKLIWFEQDDVILRLTDWKFQKRQALEYAAKHPERVEVVA